MIWSPGLNARAAARPCSASTVRRRHSCAAPRKHEEGRENQDREQEIRYWSGEHDEESLPDRPEPGRRDRADARYAVDIAGIARRAHVADELHIAAERKPGDFPARSLAIGPAEDLVAEADRKGFRRDLEQARDEIVAELVKEDERAERANEREQDQPKGGLGSMSMSSLPSSWPRTRRGSRGRSPIRRRWNAARRMSHRSSASSTSLAMSGKRISPARKLATAISLAALRTIGAAPPASSASRARLKRRKALQVRRFKVEAANRGEIEPLRWRRHPFGPGKRDRRSESACRDCRAGRAPNRRRTRPSNG